MQFVDITDSVEGRRNNNKLNLKLEYKHHVLGFQNVLFFGFFCLFFFVFFLFVCCCFFLFLFCCCLFCYLFIFFFFCFLFFGVFFLFVCCYCCLFVFFFFFVLSVINSDSDSIYSSSKTKIYLAFHPSSLGISPSCLRISQASCPLFHQCVQRFLQAMVFHHNP